VVAPETDIPKTVLATLATAYVAGIPKKIRIGVIKTPPPIPNIPDKKPTAKLKIKIVMMLT
jgi:hypothetical protein